MRMLFALILTLAMVSSCAKEVPDKPVSVADVVDNIHAWDGKIVTVVGWLGTCQGYDCGLYPTMRDAEIVATISSDNGGWKIAMGRRVSIGFDEEFDRAAGPLQFSKVSIRGKVSDECRGLFVGCTDRASDLYPISITSYSSERAN